MIYVVSFSGGRTSAYLVYLMEMLRVKNNWDVKYIFMDTGAEHPKTYEFIRSVVKHFNIDLICLRLKINPVLGQANSYTQMPLNNCKMDYQPWRDMLSKYGTPYNPGGAFCTDRLKLVPFEKYCDEHFGKGNYTRVLGIRADEPKRLKPKDNYKYLAEFSDFEKQDVLDWWKEQSFDLEINENLGNCVFCIKKGVNKIGLATKNEPRMAQQFHKILNHKNVRVVEKRRSPPLVMYRGNMSLISIIDVYRDMPEDEIYKTIRGGRGEDSGNCSESCEVLGDVEFKE